MGRGGARPGAGRKRKILEIKQSAPLEESVTKILNRRVQHDVPPTTVRQLAHKLAYVEQELEFVKKIILASLEETRKC